MVLGLAGNCCKSTFINPQIEVLLPILFNSTPTNINIIYFKILLHGLRKSLYHRYNSNGFWTSFQFETAVCLRIHPLDNEHKINNFNGLMLKPNRRQHKMFHKNYISNIFVCIVIKSITYYFWPTQRGNRYNTESFGYASLSGWLDPISPTQRSVKGVGLPTNR